MTTYTASLSFYDNWREALSDVPLRSATLKATLHTSSYTFSASHNVYADLTNELSTANGYTNGGKTLTSVSWDHTSAVAMFDADDTVWIASGGSIVARRSVVRAIGTFNGQVDPLICCILLDVTPGDVTTTSGNSKTVQWHSNGIYRIT